MTREEVDRSKITPMMKQYLEIKDENLDTEKTKALVKAITSDEVKSYIEDTYKGSVIASFIDTEGNPVD